MIVEIIHVVLILQGAEMIRHILRSDISAIRSILSNITQESNGIRRSTMLQNIVDQMGDGGTKTILKLSSNTYLDIGH